MNVDPRFLTQAGREIFTGNELLLKGALEVEGGVHLLGGYPGSPIAGFFDAMRQIQDLLNDKGIRAVINNNEALAAAMLNGTQVLGLRGLICMKSVGVHVAADALALGNLAGAHSRGGAIVVYGDDPWSDSTQVPADSRYISKHLFIPVIEPAGAQEVKDFVDLAFKLSAESELYAGYILPNNLADGGGTVVCRPNCYPSINTHQRITLESAAIDGNKFVLLPPRTWWQEGKLAARFGRAMAAASRLGINRLEEGRGDGRASVGFVSSGHAYGYLQQALWELGLSGQYPILKLGMSYPVDPELVRQLAKRCKRIVVVEERRGFIEEQIAQIVLDDHQRGLETGDVELWGKKMPEGVQGLPDTRGLHPSIIITCLVQLLKKVNGSPVKVAMPEGMEALDREMRTIDGTAEADVAPLLGRQPSFCPGCPHRDSASLCLEIKQRFMDGEYMRRRHGRGPVDLVFHGDTGCYTMLMFPPNTPLMHDYSGMGLGGGTGAGTDPFITNKQAVFMGDSTFFHSGQIAISQAIKLGQDITFIILDNSTTAMTGHQPTPGVDWDIVGQTTAVQDIEEIIAGIATSAGVPVFRINPARRAAYRRLLERALLADGVKVVIADKECGITRMRRQRRQERQEIRQRGFVGSSTHMNVNAEVCRFCLACIEMTGCPGLRHVETDYGTRMDTGVTTCVNDGACQRIGACWSFEQVTIHRKRRPRSRVPELGLDDIPEPAKRPAGEMWHAYLAGVGGMGIGLATQILVRAGHYEGYHITFLDKKGLAIRNGGVNSQVVFMKTPQPCTGTIPYGKADLILGVDVLEAARAMDPSGRMRVASSQRTAAVINTCKVPTIVGLMHQEDFDVAELERIIRAHTRQDDYLARDISRICETYLGSTIYANIMMLGFAFQKGLIPVSMHSMAWAVKDTIRADFKKNLYAFNMGRKLQADPNLFQGPPRRTGWKQTLEERCRLTVRRYWLGHRKAEALRRLAEKTIANLEALEEADKRDVVVRLYDCMRWGGISYADRYSRQVRAAYAADSAAEGYAATRAVIANLARAMLIKDSIFIAELATSHEKYARDREKYNVNPAVGDRITYRHLLPTHVMLWGQEYTLPLVAWPWMLDLWKQARFIRGLIPFWHRKERRFRGRYEAHLGALARATQSAEKRTHLVALSSARCMQCYNPLCGREGCPLENQVPQWIDFAYGGSYRRASQLLHETNNFPEFTSLLCPAPCQDQCKQGFNDYPVQIRQIERDIVERAWANEWIVPQPARRKTGKRVAVVGSGPAGLAAAQQLARAGHAVTVFEKDSAVGGLLRWGIPDFRLGKELIDRRIRQLQEEGVEFRTGVAAGVDVTGAAMRQEFDAICLATGCARPRDLAVDGRQMAGIHFALDFLRQENDRIAGRTVDAGRAISAKGKTVVVIGGGETGNDCVQTALNQGAARVHQLEIVSESQVKADPTHETPAGVDRRWCVTTQAFLSTNGTLSAIAGRVVRWVHSARGLKMTEQPGSDFTLEADMALLALGYQSVPPQPLVQQLGLTLDGSGRLALLDGCATTVPGIFIAGDLCTGATLVANAIATGRKAAAKMDEYLRRG